MATDNKKAYKAVFLTFMSYNDNQPYATNHVFAPTELEQIKPDDIVKWMNKRGTICFSLLSRHF